MDPQTIYWLFGLIITGLGYLVINDAQKTKKLAVIETIVNLLQQRFDTFIKTETDALKNIVQDNTAALDRISRK